MGKRHRGKVPPRGGGGCGGAESAAAKRARSAGAAQPEHASRSECAECPGWDSGGSSEYEFCGGREGRDPATEATKFEADSDSEEGIDLTDARQHQPSGNSVEVGADSQSDGGAAVGSDVEDDGGSVGPGGWVPGSSCGSWVGPDAPLAEQSQVLLVNVMLNFQKLPRDVLRYVFGNVPPSGTVPMALGLAARFLCMSPSRVWRAFKAVSNRLWAPVPLADRNLPRGAQDLENPLDGLGELRLLTTLVRSALAETLAGSSAAGFVRHVSRLALEGVEVGGKYHTQHFVREVQHLAARATQAQDSLDLQDHIPGLGIPSSMAILFDGVPVGGVSTFNRHGSVQVICVATVSPVTGRIHTRFVQWAVSDRGHKGGDLARCIQEALSLPPLGWTVDVLRRRLAAIGGDGAVVRGGPDRKQPGTQAADKLWNIIHAQPDHVVTDDDLLVALVDPQRRPGAQGSDWVHDPCTLSSVTEWDKFHRLDIALTRAIHSCPLAEEMYSVCALMDHLFGLGDGRLLLRTAAEAARAEIQSGRLPGMTRKAGQLCGEPGHLLGNFKAYVSGLHLREAWRASGHEQKAAKLVEAGRRLTSVQLVNFTAAFRDVMSRAVAPWVAEIQSTSLEPWVVHHRLGIHNQRLRAAASAFRCMRRVLRILVLLKQWVPEETLVSLGQSLLYARPSTFFAATHLKLDGIIDQAFGRTVPSSVLALNGMLHRHPPRFSGVELLHIDQPEPNHVLIGPHCQCPFLARGNRKVVSVSVRGRRLKIRVPQWVAGAPKASGSCAPVPAGPADGSAEVGDDDTDDDGSALQIRWMWRHQDALTAPRGVPPENRYRSHIRSIRGGHASRCTLPSHLPQILFELDSSWKAATSFIAALLRCEENLFGAEGVNAAMAEANTCMSACFDWGRLVLERPVPADVTAFLKLSQLLKRYVAQTEWPSDDFPDVVHGWPDENTLGVQYIVLLSRIRAANASKQLSKSWWKLVGWRAKPVCCNAGIAAILGRVLRRAPSYNTYEQRLRSGCVFRVASIVSDYVCGNIGGAPEARGSEANSANRRIPSELVVSPGLLARVGFPWKGKTHPSLKKRATAKEWALRAAEPASLAVLLLKGSVGKLVHLEGAVRELDWSAVSASIDANPFFSRGGPPAPEQPQRPRGEQQARRRRTSAWHAVRVHHQCRLMGVPEACCERVGSLMKMTWNKNTSVTVSTLMNKTVLVAAGVTCCGTPRDERLCRTVAEAMQTLGRAAAVGKKAAARRERAGIAFSSSVANFREDAVAALEEQGRFFDAAGDDSDEQPCDLACDVHPHDMRRGVQVMPSMVVGGARRPADLHGTGGQLRAELARGQPRMQIPADMQKELSTAVSNGVSALPVFHRRKAQNSKSMKDLPPSSKNGLLAGWLDCEEGARWKAARDSRVKKAFDYGSDYEAD